MLHDVVARVERARLKTKGKHKQTHKYTSAHMTALMPHFRVGVLSDGWVVRRDCVTQTMMVVLDATRGSVRIFFFGFFGFL